MTSSEISLVNDQSVKLERIMLRSVSLNAPSRTPGVDDYQQRTSGLPFDLEWTAIDGTIIGVYRNFTISLKTASTPNDDLATLLTVGFEFDYQYRQHPGYRGLPRYVSLVDENLNRLENIKTKHPSWLGFWPRDRRRWSNTVRFNRANFNPTTSILIYAGITEEAVPY